MKNQISEHDRRFISDLETFRIEAVEFGHRAHIRAAYIYLCIAGLNHELATNRMRNTLQALENHHGAVDSKYNETITGAWVLAVRHFMERSSPTRSAEQFINLNPQLLDKHLLFSHYSEKLLFSARAKRVFVEPDIGPFPKYISHLKTEG